MLNIPHRLGRFQSSAPPPSPPPPPPPPPPSPIEGAGPRISLTASSPITVSANNQLIKGKLITTTPGVTILPGVNGTIVEDCEITGGTGDAVIDQGSNTIVRHCDLHDCGRGILSNNSQNCEYYKTLFDSFAGAGFSSHALDIQYCSGTKVHHNIVTGSYGTDAVSFFMSSFYDVTDNDINVTITYEFGAPLITGDMIPIAEGGTGDPGHDIYVARNKIYSTGGVPPGLMGSSGNSVWELNCLTSGVQVWNYAGTFVGVTVRNNKIDMSASFVPDTGPITGWGTNTDMGSSNDCTVMP